MSEDNNSRDEIKRINVESINDNNKVGAFYNKKNSFLLHTSSLMTQLLVLLKRNIKDKGISLIHDICHFLYTGSIFKYKILHPKKHKNTQKIVKYVVFRVQSGKFYT